MIARYRSRLAMVIMLACLVGSASPAAADIREVLLVSDGAIPAYQEFSAGVRAVLDRADPITVKALDLSGVEPAAIPNRIPPSCDLIVAIGSRATERLLAARPDQPLLAALVPELAYEALLRKYPEHRAVSAIFLDQPYPRQLQLIRLAFPGKSRVGVLLGPSSIAHTQRLITAAWQHKLEINIAPVKDPDALPQALDSLLGNSELLLAIADPAIYNSYTIQHLFLTSYRYRIPIVGFSAAYVDAGALLGLFSTPEQLGRQGGELIERLAEQERPSLPPPQHPAYFSVAINSRVAKSLGIHLPPDEALLQRLITDERSQP